MTIHRCKARYFVWKRCIPNDEPGGPLAMKASADPDLMYHHEAMREPDRDEFKKAMQKGIDDQMENGNFEIIKRREVPKGAAILPAVWQMKL
jgi:hypothetical protein